MQGFGNSEGKNPLKEIAKASKNRLHYRRAVECLPKINIFKTNRQREDVEDDGEVNKCSVDGSEVL